MGIERDIAEVEHRMTAELVARVGAAEKAVVALTKSLSDLTFRVGRLEGRDRGRLIRLELAERRIAALEPSGNAAAPAPGDSIRALARRIATALAGHRDADPADREAIAARYRALHAGGMGYFEASDRAREEWVAEAIAGWAVAHGDGDDIPDGSKDRRDIDGPAPCPRCPDGGLAVREGLAECGRCGYAELAGDDEAPTAVVGEVS